MSGANSKRRQVLMRRLYEMQEGYCAFCRIRVIHPDERVTEEDFKGPLSVTIEHVVPKSRGGMIWDIRNMVLAHRDCNEERANGPIPAAVREIWQANLRLLNDARS